MMCWWLQRMYYVIVILYARLPRIYTTILDSGIYVTLVHWRQNLWQLNELRYAINLIIFISLSKLSYISQSSGSLITHTTVLPTRYKTHTTAYPVGQFFDVDLLIPVPFKRTQHLTAHTYTSSNTICWFSISEKWLENIKHVFCNITW